MNVLDLFDTLHPGPTWRPWRAFVAAVYGEPLDAEGLEIFRKHTGRREPHPEGYPEAVMVVGVQSGKTDVAAALGDHAALTGEPGTHALLVGQDHRGAMRALLRYARAPFASVPAFRAEVSRETADVLELRRGTSLSAYPCRPAALRGLRACIVCLDELGFYTATDGPCPTCLCNARPQSQDHRKRQWPFDWQPRHRRPGAGGQFGTRYPGKPG